MKYTKEEVSQFIQEEDVKFIRLAFCDVFDKKMYQLCLMRFIELLQ